MSAQSEQRSREAIRTLGRGQKVPDEEYQESEHVECVEKDRVLPREGDGGVIAEAKDAGLHAGQTGVQLDGRKSAAETAAGLVDDRRCVSAEES